MNITKNIKDPFQVKPQIRIGKGGNILYVHITRRRRYIIIIFDKLVISSVSGIWRIKR